MSGPCLVNLADFQRELSCLPWITGGQLGVSLTGEIPGNAASDPSGLLKITLQDAVTERVTPEQREIFLVWKQTMSLLWRHPILNLGIRAVQYKSLKPFQRSKYLPDKCWSYQEVVFISRRQQSLDSSKAAGCVMRGSNQDFKCSKNVRTKIKIR